MKRVNFIGLHTQFFQDFGFELNGNCMNFQKFFELGKQVVFIQLNENNSESIVEYNLGVRIDKVEELIHQFLPTLSGYAEKSITLIQTLDKIGKYLPDKFVVQNDWELSQIMMSAEKFFVLEGFPWLNKMSDPINLELAFFERKAKSFKTHNFVYNAFRATALSKLYNPSDYPYIRNIFLEHIEEQQMTPFNIASYLKFLNYLDKID
ncbi:hypothetical protein FHS59_004005 [Algoriphagus iocasae]|uniref:Uncharacterized protein n=1 Tax=Algoriphagus iocasae TaxID=1836499 RepID=A0A841MJ90_9BACT|nr:hypothetical protein [Algoriphagus iocasae]MBB6328362.1 hypothetical protein [Algoriphagus iocasae]